LVAVIKYCVSPVDSVGVPDMTPVVVSNVSPAGNEGDTDQEDIEPVTVGVLFEITTPSVYIAEVVE
jgi:hypothetical protein